MNTNIKATIYFYDQHTEPVLDAFPNQCGCTFLAPSGKYKYEVEVATLLDHKPIGVRFYKYDECDMSWYEINTIKAIDTDK